MEAPPTPRRRWSWWKIIGIFLLLLMLLGIGAFARQVYTYYVAIKSGTSDPLFEEQLQASWRTQATDAPMMVGDISDPAAPSIGPANAPVTVVAFVDYDCPFCQQSHLSWRALTKQYPETVRLVIRDFPIPELHPDAVRPSLAARCAQKQGKFWAFHDQLYQHMDQRSDEALEGIAAAVGLDVPQYQVCMANGETRAVVERDMADGMAAGIRGTPAFFFNGKKVEGALNQRLFDAILRVVLKERLN